MDHFGLGKTSAFIYYTYTRYVERRPKQLAPITNIAYSYDIHTWFLMGLSYMCVTLVLYTINQKEAKVNIYHLQ